MTTRKPLPDDVTQWTDAEIVAALVKSYRPTVIPPCHICGGELSLQGFGGGKPHSWACDGYETHNEGEPLKYKPGRSLCDRHYSDSHFYDTRQGGDDVVIEALRRWRPDLAVEEGVHRA